MCRGLVAGARAGWESRHGEGDPRERCVAQGVAVGVPTERDPVNGVGVGDAVAVVVEAVAYLDGTHKDVIVVVSAVARIGHVTVGGVAGFNGSGSGIALPVSITVGVEALAVHGKFAVHDSVTVFV